MKELIFNEKLYNIPENWNNVTLKMVILADEYSDILVDSPIIAIISAYTGIDVKELKVSKVQEVNEILGILDFISVEYKPEMKNSFEFNGVTYSADEDITNQRFEDWVSIQTILYNYRENPVLGLPKLIAVLAKKENETLDDFDLNERATLFLDLPFTTAKNLELFFSRSAIAYNTIFQLYSQMPNMEKQVLDSFQELKDTMIKRKAALGLFSGMRLRISVYQMYLWLVRNLWVRSSSSVSSKDSKKN